LSLRNVVSLEEQPNYMAVDPQGQFVYVTVRGGTVRLTISAEGMLSTPQQTETTGDNSTSTYRAPTILSVLE